MKDHLREKKVEIHKKGLQRIILYSIILNEIN